MRSVSPGGRCTQVANGLRRAVVGVVLAVRIGRAQAAPLVVPDEPLCPACQITLSTVARLGAKDGPGSLSQSPIAVRVDPLGRYWLFPGGGGPPIVYDSTGRFLKVIGSRGGGPGEFRWSVDVVFLAPDSALVMDIENHRMVIVGSDLVPRGEMPFLLDVSPLVNGGGRGRFFASSLVRTPESMGWPLHQIELRDGELSLTRSFGPDAGVMPTTSSRNFVWNLAPAWYDGFWSEDPNRMRFVRWSSDGAIKEYLERRAAWFPETQILDAGAPTRPPKPFAKGMSEQPAGILWTFTLLPSPRWREAWPKDLPESGEIKASSIDVSKLFESMIEVIDVKQRRVITRVRLEDLLSGALPGGRAWAPRIDDDGFWFIEIKQFRVVR